MKWLVLLLPFVCRTSAEEPGDGAVDGAVDLYYECVSDPDFNAHLPPIFLMYGLSGDTNMWKGINDVLASKTKRKVCMLDARNHGQSPKTEEFSFDLMAADTVRLMDKMNIKKALLVGQSLGAKTSTVIALKYPDRVEKIVSEDMRPNTITPEAQIMVRTMFEMLQKSLNVIPGGATDEEARRAVINFLKQAMGQVLTDKMEERMNDLLICENGKCWYRTDMDFYKKVIDDPEGIDKIYEGRFDGEALFIYGTLSPFKVGEAEEEIRQLFPKAQLAPIEGAGHVVTLDKPSEYLSTVIRFINDDTVCDAHL